MFRLFNNLSLRRSGAFPRGCKEFVRSTGHRFLPSREERATFSISLANNEPQKWDRLENFEPQKCSRVENNEPHIFSYLGAASRRGLKEPLGVRRRGHNYPQSLRELWAIETRHYESSEPQTHVQRATKVFALREVSATEARSLGHRKSGNSHTRRVISNRNSLTLCLKTNKTSCFLFESQR
jgi:hypothetical protein